MLNQHLEKVFSCLYVTCVAYMVQLSPFHGTSLNVIIKGWPDFKRVCNAFFSDYVVSMHTHLFDSQAEKLLNSYPIFTACVAYRSERILIYYGRGSVGGEGSLVCNRGNKLV